MISDSLGALLFGLVIGWVTYRTLRRNASTGISDIASVIGSVGGATITGLFTKESGTFGSYCLGLAVGFFLYLITAMIVAEKAGQSKTVSEWLGENPSNPGGRGDDGSLERVHR